MGEDGKEVRAYDARGELYIRGPTVIKGYQDNPVANASAFSDGWFVTGDVAYCDSTTKKWYIVDRKKVRMRHPLICHCGSLQSS